MPIIPKHSRTVKVITEAEIDSIEQLEGSLTYETTEYCVYLNADNDRVLGVYAIQGTSVEEPFIRISGIKEIGAGVSKHLVQDPSIDLSNILDVLCWLSRNEVGLKEPEIKVFISKHDHITFAYLKEPLELPVIQVVDVIPPSPSKLEAAFDVLRYSGMIPESYPVRFHLIDEGELVERIHGKDVLIPCRFTEIIDRVPQKVYSVDKDLYKVSRQSIHVIGCQRTREAADACGADVNAFDDICPARNLPEEGVFLAKCCLLRDDIELRENQQAEGVVIPWGFNYAHVFQAGVALQQIILKKLNTSV